ncbi:MAG TPA: adenylate/guanylate cyclase domain-containing protein [Terriglobia bacterium]|nr:adenylate/guanylate cyclase domain-containing protein [Terriglobia bacterium]
MTAYRIAIADDPGAIRAELATFLEGHGYQVFVAENAGDALKLARDSTIDAFMIGLEMRSGDPLALCRAIRSIDHHVQTPILCLTGTDHQDVLEDAFNAGADDFINRPIHLISVAVRLNAHLQKMEYFRKLERARRMMQRYLSPRVARLAQEYSETGKAPMPEERTVSICFTDIRGFTALSETMQPDRLFAALSGHLGKQVDIVYRFGGYVDKFGGDGLMAIFDGEDNVEKTCLCALAIMEMTIQDNPDASKFPIGIGIHTGRAMIGNIGSPEHLDYSAIGPTVNLAARLSGYAAPETVIVSDAVRVAMTPNSAVEFLEPREVQIRGVNRLVKIFRLARGKARAAGGAQPATRAVL